MPSNKSLQCLMGNMGSCDDGDEIIIGDETQVDGSFERRYIPRKLKKYDYHDFLVPNSSSCRNFSTSGSDTDDLIEDAKNFVNIAQTKLVDPDDWKDIDEKRKQRRKSRKERDKKTRRSSGKDKIQNFNSEDPFL